MKSLIIARAKSLDKRVSEVILKNIDLVNCYTCMDTCEMWKPRSSSFAWMDGRGSYDVIQCTKCRSGWWKKCSTTSTIIKNGIKLFEKGNDDIEQRIDILKERYHKTINQITLPTWDLYEHDKRTIKMTEASLHVDIPKLGETVVASIALCMGDIPDFLKVIKDSVINLKYKLVDDNQEAEIYKKHSKGDTYVIMNMSKIMKERSVCLNVMKSKKFRYTIEYYILNPTNPEAIDICNKFMNANIKNRLSKFTEEMNVR